MTSTRFSIVIPARNEEKALPEALTAIKRAAAQTKALSYEIVVVINRCSDSTEAIARAGGCVIVHEDAKNLAAIRNAGAKKACGEILITVDADSTISALMLARIDKAMNNPKIIGGGVLILPERWSLGILATGLALLPIAVFYRISGGLFFCRLKDFWEIGGFNEELVSVEDIDFAKRLKAHGKRSGRRFVSLIRAYIVTSCRKFDRFGDWYFLLHPMISLTLLRGKSKTLANKIWYDFDH